MKFTFISGIGYTGIQILNSERLITNTKTMGYDEATITFSLGKYSVVKIARRKGYIQRNHNSCVVCSYHGRYGDGFSVFRPAKDSSRYVVVEYYVSRETYEGR